MKDQFIILCLHTPDDATRLLPLAKHISTQLGKSLLLLHVGTDTAARDSATAWMSTLGEPYIVLVGDWQTAVAAMPEKLSAVLAITPSNPSAPRHSPSNPTTLLRNFAQSRIAYLAVPPQADTSQPLRHITLALDHQRESKEKLVWGSYFVRFFNSTLQILAPQYRDADLRMRQHNNMRYADKIFASLGISYEQRPLPQSTGINSRPDHEAINLPDTDLHIVLVPDSRDRDLGDWLLGTPQRRLLAATTKPLLFINQRDDIYVLCD